MCTTTAGANNAPGVAIHRGNDCHHETHPFGRIGLSRMPEVQ
jgi:hypothetical protein